jgi:hypothetical protein
LRVFYRYRDGGTDFEEMRDLRTYCYLYDFERFMEEHAHTIGTDLDESYKSREWWEFVRRENNRAD